MSQMSAGPSVRAPLSWIREFTPLEADPVAVAEALDNLGLEVEGVEAPGQEIIDDKHFSSSSWGIDRIQFADGMVWNRATMDANVSYVGTAGNDVIEASFGNDTIIGGRGDDVVSGGQGADTYVYALGDGNDIIKDIGTDGAIDTLRFTDLNAADVIFAPIRKASASIARERSRSFSRSQCPTSGTPIQTFRSTCFPVSIRWAMPLILRFPST